MLCTWCFAVHSVGGTAPNYNVRTLSILNGFRTHRRAFSIPGKRIRTRPP